MSFDKIWSSSRLLRYAVIVLFPTLFVFVYQEWYATDGFVSRAQVMVEHDAAVPVPEFAVGDLLGSTPTKADALVVKSFMESRTMLEYLEGEVDLVGHFQDPAIDIWNRLPSDASREDILEFYLSRLDVVIDPESYILDVAFVAHDREFARRVTELLVDRSEEFVNEVSHHLAREQMEFVEGEVERAHQELKKASRDLVALQQKHEVLSPERESEAAGEILGGLLQKLTEERTRLKTLQRFMSPSASEVIQARQQIAALEEQIEQERDRLVGVEGEDGLNELMLDYRDAEIGLEVAMQVYKTAIGTLESTRLEAARKVKYLVSVSGPGTPDEAEHPKVAYWVLTVFVFLNLIYFVLGLIVATIQDHRE